MLKNKQAKKTDIPLKIKQVYKVLQGLKLVEATIILDSVKREIMITSIV